MKMKILCALLLVGGLALSAGAAEERVEELDTNKDGKMDEWRFYEGQNVVRIERDREE